MDDAGAGHERAGPADDETRAPGQREAAKSDHGSTGNGAQSSIVFYDHTGTRFLLPYSACRTWTAFESLISQVYARSDDPETQSDIREKRFDIVTTDGDIILPVVWDSVVGPSLKVQLRFWSESQRSPIEAPSAGPVILHPLSHRQRSKSPPANDQPRKGVAFAHEPPQEIRRSPFGRERWRDPDSVLYGPRRTDTENTEDFVRRNYRIGRGPRSEGERFHPDSRATNRPVAGGPRRLDTGTSSRSGRHRTDPYDGGWNPQRSRSFETSHHTRPYRTNTDDRRSSTPKRRGTFDFEPPRRSNTEDSETPRGSTRKTFRRERLPDAYIDQTSGKDEEDTTLPQLDKVDEEWISRSRRGRRSSQEREDSGSGEDSGSPSLSRSRSRSHSHSRSAFGSEEDDDDIVEIDTDDDEDDSTFRPLPPPPRNPIFPTDKDGNKISFPVDTKTSETNEEAKKESEPNPKNKAKPARKPDMRKETYRILKTLSVPTETRMTLKVHYLPGPENSTTSPVGQRWIHLHGNQLDLIQFKNACLDIPGLSDRLRILTSKTFEKLGKDGRVIGFDGGVFIEPGTVLRADEKHRDDAQSVIFSCVPFFDTQEPPKSARNQDNPLHPPRSLMQSYYPYEYVRHRDMEQAFRRYGFGDTASSSIIFVPTLWVMNIGDTIVTCGYKPLKDDLVKSIELIREDDRAMNLSTVSGLARGDTSSSLTSIRLTDWAGRVLLYSPEECRSFFEMEQQLRDLKVTAYSNAGVLRLARVTDKGEEEVTAQNWSDVIKTQSSLFIDLTTLNEEKAREFDRQSQKEKPQLTSIANPSQDTVPPFFLWPQASKVDKKGESKQTAEQRVKEDMTFSARQYGFMSPELFRLMQCLDEVEKQMLTETWQPYPMTRELTIVENAFMSAKYYQALPEGRMETLENKFFLLLQRTANLGKGLENRPGHQVIVDLQCSALTGYAADFIDTVHATLKLFVGDVRNGTTLQKLWGAMANIAKVVEAVQKRGPCKVDPAEFTDPIWVAPECRRRGWTIQTHYSKFEVELTATPEQEALNKSIRKCLRCRDDRRFGSPELALNHLRKHLAILPAGPKPDEADLRDWLKNEDQLVLEHVNAGLCSILEQACNDARSLFRMAKDLADGAKNPDGKISSLYNFPERLLKTLRSLLLYYLAVERAMHFTVHYDEAGLVRLSSLVADFNPAYRGELVPFSREGLRTLTTFSSNATTSLLAVRRDLCQMARVKPSEDWHKRHSLGPEYLCSWFMRRLLVKPLGFGKTTADLYRTYHSRLQFEVNNHPSKRLIRAINTLQEELQALMLVNTWQIKLISSYRAVLDDASYQNDMKTRRAIFQDEKLLLAACLDSLAEMHGDYQDILDRCGPLSDTAKQIAEINEEDHGKAIMVFTVVTVIFLPLSFVTSYLGMNTSDIRDMNSKQSLFWEIAVPLTVVTMGTIIIIAYNGDEIREHLQSWYRLFTGKQDEGKDARGVSISERKRISIFSDSATTLEGKSFANEAEFAPPKPTWQTDPEQHLKNRLAQVGFKAAEIERILKSEQTFTTSRPSRNPCGDDMLTPASFEPPGHRSHSYLLRSRLSGNYHQPPPLPAALIDDHVATYDSLQSRSQSFNSNEARASGSTVKPEVSAEANAYVPTYARVHKQFLTEETLSHFKVPWEYDSNDPNFRIILQDIGTLNLDLMFRHTKKSREHRKRDRERSHSGRTISDLRSRSRCRYEDDDFDDDDEEYSDDEEEDEWYGGHAPPPRRSRSNHYENDNWYNDDEWYSSPSVNPARSRSRLRPSSEFLRPEYGTDDILIERRRQPRGHSVEGTLPKSRLPPQAPPRSRSGLPDNQRRRSTFDSLDENEIKRVIRDLEREREVLRQERKRSRDRERERKSRSTGVRGRDIWTDEDDEFHIPGPGTKSYEYPPPPPPPAARDLPQPGRPSISRAATEDDRLEQERRMSERIHLDQERAERERTRDRDIDLEEGRADRGTRDRRDRERSVERRRLDAGNTRRAEDTDNDAPVERQRRPYSQGREDNRRERSRSR